MNTAPSRKGRSASSRSLRNRRSAPGSTGLTGTPGRNSRQSRGSEAAGLRSSVRTETGPCMGQQASPSLKTRLTAEAPKSRQAVHSPFEGSSGEGSRFGRAPTD